MYANNKWIDIRPTLPKHFLLICITIITFTCLGSAQNIKDLPTQFDNVFWGNHHMNAIDASRFADGKREPYKKETPVFVGVAVHVEKDHRETPETWGKFLAKMFKHYEVPAKIYLDETIDPGQNCVITIYVNGFSYRKGDYDNGTISPAYLTENHKKVMADIKKLYKQANSIE